MRQLLCGDSDGIQSALIAYAVLHDGFLDKNNLRSDYVRGYTLINV